MLRLWRATINTRNGLVFAIRSEQAVREELFALIGRLHASGLSILLVEQNVVQSLAIASRAYVIEHGVIALSGKASALADDPRLRSAYLGL